MSRPSYLTRLAELAQDQWGLVTRRQLVDAGIGSTTLERLVGPSGALERVAWGVYQLAGTPAPGHRDLRAAWLQLAPETRHAVGKRHKGSSRTGLRPHYTDWAIFQRTSTEFTVPHRHQTRRPDVRIHVRPVGDDEWARVDGLPVTRPRRITTDLVGDPRAPKR